jgi:hypothetical protein
MKGQSFIIEFILFFLISFSLFITISYLFYNQDINFDERIGNSLSELISDIVSIRMLKSVECKACSNLVITESIPSRIGGFFYGISLDQYGLNTTLFSNRFISKRSTVFNLNETFKLFGNTTSENKKVEIIINNVDKNISVR